MADYYNKTKGPVAVTLQRGGSVLIGSKKWLTIDPLDEGHESLQRALTKGFLARSRASCPEPEVSVDPVPVVPETIAEPVAPAALASGPKLDEPKSEVRSGKKGR